MVKAIGRIVREQVQTMTESQAGAVAVALIGVIILVGLIF